MFVQNRFRLIALSLIAVLVVAVCAFFVIKHGFKADTPGTFTVSGTIYGQDTKKALADVDISLSSSSNTEAEPVAVKTDASGHYSISAPSSDFTNISIVKDGYWDIEGVILNYNTSGSFILNLDLKTGFGKEDVEVVATASAESKKGTVKLSTTFGLSVEPFNNSPASLTEVIPSGDTYSTNSLASSLSFYNQGGDFTFYDKTKADIETKMSEVAKTASQCKEKGGSVFITYDQPNEESDPANWKRLQETMKQGTQPVCDVTNIADEAIKSQLQSINYPLLPEGYIYYYPAVDATREDGTVFAAVEDSDSGDLLCKYSGYVRTGNWGKDFSLYRGQTINYTVTGTGAKGGTRTTEKSIEGNLSKTIILRGRAKTDKASFQTVAGKTFYFADPFTTELNLSNIKITDGTETYSLSEAKEKGLIVESDPINLIDGTKATAITDLTTATIKEGQAISFKVQKSVSVEVGGENIGPSAFGKIEFSSEPTSTNFFSEIQIFVDPIGYYMLNDGEKLPLEYRMVLGEVNSAGHFSIGPLPKGKQIALIASYNNLQSRIVVDIPDDNNELILSEALEVKPPEPNPNNWNSATLHLTAKDKDGQNIDGETVILTSIDQESDPLESTVTNGQIEFPNLPFGSYIVLITKGGPSSIVTYKLGTTGTVYFHPTTYTPPMITDSFILEEEK